MCWKRFIYAPILPIPMIHQKITIISYRKPNSRDINAELQWFGNALGLFSDRDKDSSCFRLFITLLKGAKVRHAFTSDELAYQLGLSRGTVVHHLNKLMQAGIVIHSGNRYILRVDTLSMLVDEIKKDVERSLEDLKEIAEDIDSALGL